MVFDNHKNGIPVAWVITSSATQANVAKWLADLQQHMRRMAPTFQPSCFLVDDSRAEINAIRYKRLRPKKLGFARQGCVGWGRSLFGDQNVISFMHGLQIWLNKSPHLSFPKGSI